MNCYGCATGPIKPQYSFTPPPASQANLQVQERVEESTYITADSYISIRSESKTLLYNSPAGVSAYQQVAPMKPESIEVAPAQENNQYSNAILSAIEAQLMRDVADGATTEELQSRLESGLSGFEEGFAGAMAQLEGLPGFSPEVASEVNQTRDQVHAGIAALADRLGLESPVDVDNTTAEPESVMSSRQQSSSLTLSDSRQSMLSNVLVSTFEESKLIEDLLQSTSQPVYGNERVSAGYQVSEQKSFGFNLVTQDGDEVTIRFANSVSGSSALNQGGVSVSGDNSQQFMFQVDGDLDEDELRSIEDLLSQVAEISEFFFGGDVDKAVQYALDLQYNQDEIQSFDLGLRHSVSERGYQSVGGNGVNSGGENPYVQSLIDKVQSAQQSAGGFSASPGLVADLADWMSLEANPSNQWAHHVGGIVRQLL